MWQPVGNIHRVLAMPAWPHGGFQLTHLFQGGCVHDGHHVLGGAHEGQQAAVRANRQGIGGWVGVPAHHVSCRQHGGTGSTRWRPKPAPGCGKQTPVGTSYCWDSWGFSRTTTSCQVTTWLAQVTVATGGNTRSQVTRLLPSAQAIHLLLQQGWHRPSLTFHSGGLRSSKTTLTPELQAASSPHPTGTG